MWNEPTNQEIEQKLNDLYAEQLARDAQEQAPRKTLELDRSYTEKIWYGSNYCEPLYYDELIKNDLRGW